MAGINKKGIFLEKISPFIHGKMELLKSQLGESPEEYKALFLQYVKQEIENAPEAESNRRHWEADLMIESTSNILGGIERLYSQSAVIEPTMICASHCRYCLRANYEMFTLSEEELKVIAQYCGSDEVKGELSEVLVSGGDPFVVPKRLKFLVEALIEYAPNVKRIRIGTRLPLHDPNRVGNDIFEIFRRHQDRVRFEIATQINHPVELFPEVISIFNNIRKLGIKIYSQNVLIKGVNDNIDTLVNLYRKLRELDIEPHYLFHSVPMRGMHHLRTSVKKGLELAKELTNSGKISGRIKPMFALMTDIGKVTLYEGTILERNEDNFILIKTSYKYKERMALNPGWQLPKTAVIDKEGYLQVWYLDGKD